MSIKRTNSTDSEFKIEINKDSRKKLRNKKAEGLFGMSFSMIFSIILIVFFIIVAFIAIRAFLNVQKCTQIGIFFSGLEDSVKEAMNCGTSCSFAYNATLPSGVEYVCTVNLSASFPFNANNIEKGIWEYVQNGAVSNIKNNIYLYSPSKAYCSNFKQIKYIDISSKNPNCIKVIGGKVSINIERKFEKPLVYLS